MPVPRESHFLVAGASVAGGPGLASLIGRADGDLRVGDLVLEEVTHTPFGTIVGLRAYRHDFAVLSSGMTAEVSVRLAPGAPAFGVPSRVLVRAPR